MCGIFAYVTGFLNVQKNFELGKSRGPEFSQLIHVPFSDYTLYLGFHRLAINDLEPTGNQPFFIKGVYLICNGEIYNYKKLGAEFEMESKSDCEVIIHLYLKYGIDYLLQLLDGVFAFVIYDSNISKIFIARDPYGVRPLYIHEDPSEIGIASEFKQLCGSVQFQPGHYCTVGTDLRCTITRYHCHSFSKMIFNNQFDIYGIIYQYLYSAVRKRVQGTTERPIACLLSGGLDSSTITALVHSFVPNVETYSIGLEGSPDLKYAQIVADYLGTKHTSIVLTEDQFFDAIPEVIKAISSYDTTTVRASVGNYLVGKYISEHSDAKVIFNGDGSDELTGGYLYFNKCDNLLEFDRECKRLLSDIHHFDVLRSDRCISTHGLEPRTPFLDRGFVETYLSVLPEIRSHPYNGLPEKFLLRQSIEFMNSKLLPPEILNRTKEAFSDGVSAQSRSWYKIIEEKVNGMNIPDFEYEHLPPQTAEQRYYRFLFEKEYPHCGYILPYFWMPKWSNTTDPSARTL